MIMAIIMHPLTAKNGSPEYTADDYRHAINPLLVPSDGTAFNGLSGIRYGSPSPLVTVSGLTVTVKPHCGTISPWDGLGAYTYAITTNTTVKLADSTNDYKIAVTVEDPSQSHGTTPRGQLKVFTAGTPDSNINGLVIAEVNAGVASDVAPMIRNNAILMARDLTQLNTIDAVDGQEAVTIVDNAHYVRNGGAWESSDTPQEMIVFACSKVIRLSTDTLNPVLYSPSELETLAKKHGITGNLNTPCISVMNGDWNTTSIWINGVMRQNNNILLSLSSALKANTPLRVNSLIGFAR
ncbi:MAG: hypothetical protein [Bacteriophage sp.]|nr:MAG: hypothetical protein [Bacteriophage sp.]